MKYFVLLLLWLLPAYGFAQQLHIDGHVFDEDQVPLAGADVSFGDQRVRTDAAGNFFLPLSGPGRFELTFSKAGFRTQRRSVAVGQTSVQVRVRLLALNRQLKDVKILGTRDAQFREQPMNLRSVDAGFITRNLGGSLMKTLERLPGVKTIGIGSGQSKPLIRGLGFNRVVVVEKGVKHEGQQWGADHGLEIDQFAAGRVDIVKGAASFLYGSDAIGGVVRIEPPAAPTVNGVSGEVTGIAKGNNNLIGGSVQTAVKGDKWFADGRFSYQDYGDYKVPASQVNVYNYPVDLYRNRLRNTAGEERGLHLNAGYMDSTFRSTFFISNVWSKSGFFANAHGLEPRRVDATLHDARSGDILMPSQQVNHFKILNRSSWQTGKQLFEAELGFQRNFRQEHSMYVNHGYMPPAYPADMTISPALERQFDKYVYSFNLRNTLAFEHHSLTVGLNTENQRNSISGWSFLVPAFRQFSAGLFAVDNYRLSSKLLLQTAIRYDHVNFRSFAYRDWFSTPLAAGGQENLTRAEAFGRNFSSLTWSAGLNYSPMPFFARFNIGKSFRVPIAKELAANGVNYHYFSYERGNPELAPEQSYQADAGIGWKDDAWDITLSPYLNYFSNYIYLNPTPFHDYDYGAGNQIFAYTQSRVLRYGLELELSRKLGGGRSVELLGEYLYARQLSGDKKGFTLPFSPPPSVLFSATQAFRSGRWLQNAFVSADYRLTAAQNNIVPPERKTPSSGVADLRAGATLLAGRQPVNLNLQIRNLLNTKYFVHTSFYRLIDLPEMGRDIVLSISMPFGHHQKKNN
ncbi:TonB-dependent receptor [Pedobacter sp. SYP-B3415]|uniref:TonB-dependent receptor n=1 Tax=Pedobacter sp. SYP-B3415 TaxID=2496641 RepID=UPI00101D3675|nr:TonB-dependent receptor [Pedobacter sp. SYP-B3415]